MELEYEEFGLTGDQIAILDQAARSNHPAWLEFYQAFLSCEEYTLYGIHKRFFEGVSELLRKLA